MDYLAHVTKSILDLVPTFLRNRKAEIPLLLTAVEENDLDRLQHLGERMYAVGNPYGFRQITTFGRQLREAVAAADCAAVLHLVRDYEDYLAKVQVVVVDEPVPRTQWPAVIETRVTSQPRRIVERPKTGTGRRRRRRRSENDALPT